MNENIYFDYDASVENLSITATLTYPDKTAKNINLPNSIKAEQIGTYELDATASKLGYKTIKIKEQFGVIKEAPSISYTKPRDEIAKGEETEETSPTATATPPPTSAAGREKDNLIYFPEYPTACCGD